MIITVRLVSLAIILENAVAKIILAPTNVMHAKTDFIIFRLVKVHFVFYASCFFFYIRIL